MFGALGGPVKDPILLVVLLGRKVVLLGVLYGMHREDGFTRRRRCARHLLPACNYFRTGCLGHELHGELQLENKNKNADRNRGTCFLSEFIRNHMPDSTRARHLAAFPLRNAQRFALKRAQNSGFR